MESVPCNFCGANQPEKQYDLVDWMTGSAQLYILVRCGNCGLRYLNPRPTSSELMTYYPDQYAPYYVPTGTSLQGMIRSGLQQWVWQRRSSWIRRYSGLQRGSFLDVGCASGDFLVEMQRSHAWRGTGIEISSVAAAIARERSGSKIIEDDLLNANLPHESFDLVTFWDVMEHLSKPFESLQTAYHLLKPGGWLVVRVPDPECLSARVFKQDWVSHDPPRHLYAFPREILVSKLMQIGFKPIQFHYLTGDYFAFTMSLSIYFSRKHFPRMAVLFRSLSRSFLLRAITIPIFIIPPWLKMGASISYFAHKPVSAPKDP